MGTLQSWRKAYGALKDSTTVGLAKVNSEFKDLDIAIVKATNHVERPPKERHVLKIFAATSMAQPRDDVAYCIHALGKRLDKTQNWTVALKTLVVIHRTLREGDPTFREELLNYSRRGNILQLSNFKDDSSPLAWDCSAWVRTYAFFLEEKLECFKVLKYDIEAERFTKPGEGLVKTHCRTRELRSGALLVQMPALQQLLYRLVGCQPEGAAFGNFLIQYALAMVLKESFKLYCAINDGIINLVDVFFEMPRHEAVKALEIYKRSGQQAESLSEFYEVCKGLEIARNFKFPLLKQPPPSFLATMEEYIKEAPKFASASSKRLECQERNMANHNTEVVLPKSPKPALEVEDIQTVETQNEAQIAEENAPPPPVPPVSTVDLLGLNEINPHATLIEESNALALAIVPSDGAGKTSTSGGGLGITLDPTGWELALVTTDTSSMSVLTESKLAGGFDKLLLDSLYDDGEARKQQQPQYGVSLGANLFDARDPFAMSHGVAPPTHVQMALLAQQQQQITMTTMQAPYQFTPPQQGLTANPFGDPLSSYSTAQYTHGNSSLL